MYNRYQGSVTLCIEYAGGPKRNYLMEICMNNALIMLPKPVLLMNTLPFITEHIGSQYYQISCQKTVDTIQMHPYHRKLYASLETLISQPCES